MRAHQRLNFAHRRQRLQPPGALSALRRRIARNGAAIYVGAVALSFASSGLAAGDIARGKALYGVCATCHGPNAEGMQEMNAPALAGREEWYLIRQLNNFRSGVRGSNPADVYGLQMAPMAQVLADQQAIEDVAAYLRSLKP